ncbi:hypothetical protein B5S29_g4869 [[Candida] boidinii]|nr:hypothetical protein B5S29_g4869 [[Candida] boidinii]
MARKLSTKEKKPEDYQSSTLSKKDQRKLKKITKKAEEVELQEDKEEDEDEEDEVEDEDEQELDLNILQESASEDDDEDDDEEAEDDEDEEAEENEDDEEKEEEEEEEEEDVPLSDVEFDSDADIVPYTKLTVNNVAALKESLSRVQIPWEKYQFDEGQTVTYNNKVESEIKDIYDDTERELAFFKQGLHAAIEGRKQLLALKVPFSRPMDFFAEMVKSDEHMEKLKTKLVQEATEKKAREEARRQRQLKKFGKQVQHETLQQRQKEKKDALDKFKSLKRKRQNNEIGADEFDIAVEEAAGYQDDSKKGGNKKSKIQSKISSKSSPKKRPGKNRRRNKRKN